MQLSLRAGKIVSIDVPRTICDGQQTQAVGRQPFEVIRRLVHDVLTVPDGTVIEAMRFGFERLKVVLEPSGACALAALMDSREQFRGQRVGVTLSGGNVDAQRFFSLLSGAVEVRK
jgi:threonine dehydratase